MQFVDTLIEIGSAVPSVLGEITSRSAAASAVECIRQVACKGGRDTLSDPPPALLHASKTGYVNLLYGGQMQGYLRDGPYMHVSRKTFCESALEGVCVGGVIVDVCAGVSRPAIVFARPIEAERRFELVLNVYDAPLAAMEVELFSGVGAPSAFEQKWLQETAASSRLARAEAGQFARSRGFDEIPDWLHSNEYAVERPGALMLLRARLPSTNVERDELRAALESETRPRDGVFPLKDVMQHVSLPGMRVTLRTVFYAQPLSDKPEQGSDTSGTEGCAGAKDFSVIAPLALLVLKHLETEDYYGVDAGEKDAEEWQGCGDEAAEAVSVAEEEAIENVLSCADANNDDPHDPHEPPLLVNAKRTLAMALALLRRPCDMKFIVRTDAPRCAGLALARAFVRAEDLPRAAALFKEGGEKDVEAAISNLASSLGNRHAVLLVEKLEDGRIGECKLLSHRGYFVVPHDSIVRYALFTWVTPIVREGDTLSEIKVHAVLREPLWLKAVDPADVLPEAPPAAPPAPIVPEALSTVLSELTTLLPEVRAAMSALKPPAAPAAPPVTAQPVSAAAMDPPDSAVTRALKRTIAYLEAN